MNVYDLLKQKIPCKIDLKSKVNGDVLIVSSVEISIFYLNGVAKDFYLSCDGKKTVEDIVIRLLSRYAVSVEELQADIVSLVRDLQWKKLILLKG